MRSLPRTVGVSPAQDASLRAEANRVMSPTPNPEGGDALPAEEKVPEVK